MPPGRPQSICHDEIEKRYREIDELNAQQYAEDLARSRQVPSAAPVSSYPGVGVGVVLIALGLLFSSYSMIAGGGAVVMISLGIMGSRSARAVQRPDLPTPARERFQWRP